jgi:hypothetical protein
MDVFSKLLLRSLPAIVASRNPEPDDIAPECDDTDAQDEVPVQVPPMEPQPPPSPPPLIEPQPSRKAYVRSRKAVSKAEPRPAQPPEPKRIKAVPRAAVIPRVVVTRPRRPVASACPAPQLWINAMPTSTRTHVVVAHYNENLDWTRRLDPARFELVIASKTLPHAHLHVRPNIGYEASAYLRYIIRRYHSLPEYMVFVHGHETSWHHDGNLDDVVNHLIMQHKRYRNINRRDLIKTFVMDGEDVTDDQVTVGQLRTWREHKPKLFPGLDFLVDAPQSFRCRMCAQFFVHRDLILRHSLSAYNAMWRAMRLSRCGSKDMGIVYEHTWCWLLTGYSDELEWEATDDPLD